MFLDIALAKNNKSRVISNCNGDVALCRGFHENAKLNNVSSEMSNSH